MDLTYQKAIQKVYLNNTQTTEKLNSHNVQVGLNPGLSYQLTRRILTELSFNRILSIGYRKEKGLQANGGSTEIYNRKSFDFNTDLNLQNFWNPALGFRIIF